jgi:hypothetical protein
VEGAGDGMPADMPKMRGADILVSLAPPTAAKRPHEVEHVSELLVEGLTLARGTGSVEKARRGRRGRGRARHLHPYAGTSTVRHLDELLRISP